MPKPFNCPEFVQSPKVDGRIMNSCIKCGRTKEAHERDKEESRPGLDQADEWMIMMGYKGQSYFHLARGILARYIDWKKQQ